MKKYWPIIPFFLLLFLVSVAKVTAEESKSIRWELRKERIDNLKERVEERKASIEAKKEERKNMIEEMKNKLGQIIRFGARITGSITAINGSTLTVNTDGKDYQVNISSTTQLRRRFGGQSSFSEFSTGNQVNVVGKWTDENKTVIDAKMVRDLSIQKRFGVFFGEVKTKNSDNFIISTQRGDQTVVFSNAKFVNRKKETISYTDVVVGHRVRVKGIWDRSLNKITEVNEVKDFSLPVITQTVTPTPES